MQLIFVCFHFSRAIACFHKFMSIKDVLSNDISCFPCSNINIFVPVPTNRLMFTFQNVCWFHLFCFLTKNLVHTFIIRLYGWICQLKHFWKRVIEDCAKSKCTLYNWINKNICFPQPKTDKHPHEREHHLRFHTIWD